jgi:hypothetical protein
VTACADPRFLDERYVYLLGIYLGDGTIAAAPRNVWRLRLFQDERYPDIVNEIGRAAAALTDRAPGRMQRDGCVEVYSNWKHWICVFPQHGPGRKHLRKIQLRDWQRRLVGRYPEALLRGLIQSDGCRVINRVRRPTKSGVKTYAYARYHFSNVSGDIRDIFTDTCRLLGVDCRPNNATNISVARRPSVELLDTFIGPKR